jgi:23S rRNA (uracil1939-C5)-methyltransferase
MRAGDRLQVDCQTLDDRGAGAGEVNGRAVHVAGALPGERVTAQVEHLSPHAHGQVWARLLQVLEPAAERVAPVCPGHGRCGGCPLQHLDYPAQVRWKGERVAAALGRHEVEVEACVPSPRPLGYRNQGKYVYGPGETGAPVLGAYQPRSHSVVELLGCRVVEPLVDQVARRVHELLVARGVPPYQELRRTGLVRYVVIRGNTTGQALVTLVVARRRWDEAGQLARTLRAAEPAIAGVVLNVNESTGNAVFGDEEVILDGAGTIEDQIGPVTVQLASRSFFQVNRSVAERAYADLAEALGRHGPVARAVDVYAGAGGIAFTLTALAREVIAIEENEAATSAAAAFAERQKFNTVRFVTGDAATHLAAVGRADRVVLNPPRSGCAPQVLDAVAALEPDLVAYLSCHPGTLERDLQALGRHGYVTEMLRPYDMHPHTLHVETLAVLARGFRR